MMPEEARADTHDPEEEYPWDCDNGLPLDPDEEGEDDE